jgi:DNA-binding response OmpR family regulator
MPEIDGFELTSKLHELDDSIPIIVLTAKDITTEDRLRLNHVADIFQKGSYSRDELLAKVSHLLSATV